MGEGSNRGVLVSDFDGTMTDRDFYKLVREALVPPDTPDFWASCDGLGGPATYRLWGTAADGKGEPGQTNQVSHGCPPARFRNITVLNTAAV